MGTTNRFPYETSVVLDQAFLDDCHDNLTNKLEMICEIETPSGTIYASDRNKYVGSTFYEALLKFPTISRTVGEWLSPELTFSTISLEISNVDGRFNYILPGGSGFGGWIGKMVEVKLGLRDVASTYTTIFSGFITDVGGFGRTTKSIKLSARDRFDSLNVNFPKAAFTSASFPNISSSVVGKIVPIIYGDWTVNVNEQAASIPAYPMNSEDAAVNAAPWNNIQLRISDNDNTFFDTTQVWLFRGSKYYVFNAADIVNVNAGKFAFEIDQNTGATLVEGNPYTFEKGDNFFVKVKGKDLGAYDNNMVWIARDILLTYTNLIAGDFDANWATFRDKASPAESAIANIKARAWIQEPQNAIQYALSLLEQVRLEAFIDRNLKLKINSLHFDDFVASPTFNLRNWDIVKESFAPRIDEKNNFNRARGTFNFLPDENANHSDTSTFKNDDAIAQAGKEISKRLIYPNLHDNSTGDVDNQVTEMLKLASAYMEIIDCELTWRSLLLDIGDFVNLRVNIGATILDDIPAMIRDVGYNPQGLKVPVKLFSFQMVPFPGFTPAYPGTTTGGSTATITQE